MSSAPYWGQLPGPKVQSNGQRGSAAEVAPADSRRQSVDSQAQHQTNRASGMTNLTDSTFSPSYETPPTSAFDPRGLAPRPPSYQMSGGAGTEGPLDVPKRRSRRPPTHDMGAYDDMASSDAPAAEAGGSRGPTLSYRHPQGSGGLPYAQSTSAQPPTSRHAVSNPLPDADMEPEDYYRNRRSDGPPTAAGRPVHNVQARRDHSEGHQAVAVPARRSSASGPSERRKKFADDRSPLQRLELTLDSMTKEEKRARVEAAEKRARDRAARKASVEQAPPPVQDTRGHGRQQSISQTRADPSVSQTPAHVVVSPPLAAAPARRVVSERRPPQEAPPNQMPSGSLRGRPHDRNMPQEQLSQWQNSAAQPPPEEHTGIPQRNLSFRDRAAQDDAMPHREDVDVSPPGHRSGGFSLTRSGSNKLRKEPPGGPWYHHRMEAEQRLLAANHGVLPAAHQTPPEAIPRSMRDKQLPPDPPLLQTRHGANERDFRDRSHYLEPAGDTRGIRRSFTEPTRNLPHEPAEENVHSTGRKKTINFADEAPGAQVHNAQIAHRREHSPDSEHRHRISGMIFRGREHMRPGDGLYKPPEWLEEWKKGTVGTLGGKLLDLDDEVKPPPDAGPNKAWWENDPAAHRRSSSYSARPRKAEAFAGEYDDTKTPTRFRPALHLQCGPLLRYCGMRNERFTVNQSRDSFVVEKEMWRGSVMIVTKDADSSYEIGPTLRLFVQNIELLDSPPHQVNGELPPEHVDPIAGHPKVGRRGETLYVRPVDHVKEEVDLSQKGVDEGLFESTRSSPDGTNEPHGSFTSRRKRVNIDGERMQKYKDVRGFRLHAERGYTFWRFNIEVELREQQQRIAYRINRGPAMSFWVPAQKRVMNIMFHSCNGFSSSVDSNNFCGPDPMWRDVLNTHQSQPFHVMVGGGDQIYNDSVATECQLFDEWLDMRSSMHKHNAPFSAEMQDQMEAFYLERYCKWFSQGLFGLATSQIPMINMLDDHDIYDGYGSYPHHSMNSPVMSGLGAVAFKYYMLFQHQSIIPETENAEPSWITGPEPGPYINEQSRSVYMSLGGKVALLAVDARTERTEHDVIHDKTWEKITNRLYAEVRRGQVEHLLVLLGVPVAYPRLDWLETILTSRLMNPIKALGRTGALGKVLNKIDDGVEVMDDLNDHWTAKNHKQERRIVIEDLQDLAIDKSLRITMLSGDVHLAAIGQFYSNPKLGLAKHRDPRYMLNVISSAIVNAPPPDLMADILNKRNKTYQFDKQTNENMVPIFQHGVDGKARNNKRLLPHRNWCAIRAWTPGTTPPRTPPMSDDEEESSQPPPPSGKSKGGNLLRRLSGRKSSSSQPDVTRQSVRGSRPPISGGGGGGGGGGGLFRKLSRRNSTNSQQPRPGFLTRTLSLGRDDGGADKEKRGGFLGFGRRGSRSRPNDGGINGQWGTESEEAEDEYYDDEDYGRQQPSGLRGGAAPNDEFSDGDDAYFTARPPRRAHTIGSSHPPPSASSRAARQQWADHQDGDEDNEDFEPEPSRRPFHRTPTGLSAKQMRKADKFEVDLEGGLDIRLNVEVNRKDPTGITVPYRVLVPKLFYEYNPGVDALPPQEEEESPKGLKRLLSLRKKRPAEQRGGDGGLSPEDHAYGEGRDERYT